MVQLFRYCNRNRIRLIHVGLLILLITFFQLIGNAKSAGDINGDGHSGDIVKVLGIDCNAPNIKKIINLVSTVANTIDDIEDARELNREIKKLAPNFNWGNYGHRLFFHWGFNKSPQSSMPLYAKVNECTDDAEIQKQIWDLILERQSIRNKSLMRAVSNLGPLTRGEQNGIASLIYDVHILGDYIEGEPMPTLALFDINELIGDLNNALRNLDCSDYGKLNEIKREMNSTFGQKKERANNILNILKERVPEIIKSTNRVQKALYGK